ncbi:hypothetical protein FACS1894109_20380 [Spirochaetia bacterium]|nr:hypothetical protein FACS1894109_20380 [Spirochaetia bacterium]
MNITCPKCGETVILKNFCETCGADLRELVKDEEKKEQTRELEYRQEEGKIVKNKYLEKNKESKMEKEQSLSRIGEAGGDNEGLQIVARNLRDAIQTGNDSALQSVNFEIQRRPGIFGIMFPGRILRENEELSIQNMKDMYGVRQDMLKAWVHVQLELTKNEGQMIIKSKLQGYEGELSQQAMQIRTDLTKFSQQKIAEMMDTFDRSTATFAERIAKQTKEAERYKDTPFLYAKLQQNLEKEAEMFFATISELLDGFKEALNNKLNQN